MIALSDHYEIISHEIFENRGFFDIEISPNKKLKYLLLSVFDSYSSNILQFLFSSW